MGWAIKVGIKMGIKGAIFWPTAATSLALLVSIPSLIDDGIIDSNGKIIAIIFDLYISLNACVFLIELLVLFTHIYFFERISALLLVKQVARNLNQSSRC